MCVESIKHWKRQLVSMKKWGDGIRTYKRSFCLPCFISQKEDNWKQKWQGRNSCETRYWAHKCRLYSLYIFIIIFSRDGGTWSLETFTNLQSWNKCDLPDPWNSGASPDPRGPHVWCLSLHSLYPPLPAPFQGSCHPNQHASWRVWFHWELAYTQNYFPPYTHTFWSTIWNWHAMHPSLTCGFDLGIPPISFFSISLSVRGPLQLTLANL